MKNWKTTLFGLIGGLMTMFGPRLQGDHTAPPINIAAIVQAVAIAAIGLAAKDSNVTGGTKSQSGGTVAADPAARTEAAEK